MITVMVTGAGSGIGMSILKSLALANRSLRNDHPDMVEISSGPCYRVIAADCDRNAPGLYAGCNASIVIPPANGSGYTDALISACQHWKVDVLIPGCDPELKVISALKADIEAETATRVLVSPWWSVRKMADKVIMAEWLQGNGFCYPKTTTHLGGDQYKGDVPFPLVAKPRDGSGSTDTWICDIPEQLYSQAVPGNLYCIQEYLQGTEYTTSVMVGGDGIVCDQRTFERLMPKIGEGHQLISRRTVQPSPDIVLELYKIAFDLRTLGCCNIQWKPYAGRVVPFEINMRFPGSTILCAASGMNGPDLAIQDLMGGPREVNPLIPITAHRHLSEVYIPETGNPFTLENLQCTSVSPEELDT